MHLNDEFNESKDSIRFKREIVIGKINNNNSHTEKYIKYFNKNLKKKISFTNRIKKYYKNILLKSLSYILMVVIIKCYFEGDG